MKLSQAERWILSNQFRILELLDKDEADHWSRAKSIIENGYEAEYDYISQYIDADVTTEDESREVRDILTMFVSIQRSYEALSDKPDVEEWRIKFLGFDGNNEVKQLAYARYLCEQENSIFASLERGDNFNSHCPVLDRYRSMLSEWKKSENKYELSKDDIERIGGVA